MVDALLWIAVIGVGLVALHNLALWAERHGWIFYKYRRASPGTAGRAFLEAQSLLEPGKHHVVQSQRDDETEQEPQGEPPVAGGTSREDG